MAEAQAMAERRRLAQEAAEAAQSGNATAAADLIEQARAVEAAPVPAEPAPVSWPLRPRCRASAPAKAGPATSST